MYVCRIFDKTVVLPSGACLIIPAPSLLADPSRPRARYDLSDTCFQSRIIVEHAKHIPGFLRGDLLSLPGMSR